MTPCEYSIGRRLSIQLAAQTVVGLGVLALLIYGALSMLFSEKHQEELRNHVAVMSELIRIADSNGGQQEVLDRLAWSAERRSDTYLILHAPDGQEVYRDPKANFRIDAASASQMPFQVTTSSAFGGQLAGTLYLDCMQDYKAAARMVFVLVAAVILGGLMAGVGSFWRVRCGLRPVLELAAQTRAIDVKNMSGRLSLPVPVVELKPLIEQFNGLMDRVQATYTQLEGFNADVAHELRTPLTTLIGQTELALSKERTSGELEDTLVSNLEELQRMAAIVNDMLFLSQADRGVKARRTDVVGLASLAHAVIEFHEASLADSNLQVQVSGDVALPVDPPLVKRALSNLLGNAIRYAKPQSTLKVCMDATTDALGNTSAKLWVENEGPAIPPDQISRIFDRFFRADPARSEVDKPHHGLGLSIVAAIARMHDGQPWAESGQGLTRVGFSLRQGGEAA